MTGGEGDTLPPTYSQTDVLAFMQLASLPSSGGPTFVHVGLHPTSRSSLKHPNCQAGLALKHN